jgi:hypothetical protein
VSDVVFFNGTVLRDYDYDVLTLKGSMRTLSLSLYESKSQQKTLNVFERAVLARSLHSLVWANKAS